MDYSRQLDIFNPQSFNTPVHVIGAGATGSWVVLMLAKMGIKDIHVWDFDVVEEHNLPNQAFFQRDIGYSKSNSIGRIADECNYNLGIDCHNEKVDGSQRLSGIVFMLTDTMSSRKEIYEKAIKLKPSVKLLIETRMDLKGGFVYTINPINMTQIKEYEQSFYTDEEAAVSACGTSQSLIATAMQISSIAVWQLINYHNGNKINNLITISSEYNQTEAFEW